MIASTQTTNIEISAFIPVLVFIRPEVFFKIEKIIETVKK